MHARHGGATEAQHAGASLADIAEHAQHTDINTTHKHYIANTTRNYIAPSVETSRRIARQRVAHRQAKATEIKRQFGGTVDFVGNNRVIFDLGGNKYRLIVHVSYTFGRVLVKFIGTHAEYDRIDPKTVSWRKK